MSHIRRILGFALRLAASAGAPGAIAGPVLIDVPTSPPLRSMCLLTNTCGYRFTANQDVVVSRLGVYDYGQDGLEAQSTVRVWTLGGAELASLTLAAGAGGDLLDAYRYGDIAPLALVAGMEYVVGVYGVLDVPDNLNGVTVDPAVTIGAGVFVGGSGFPAQPDPLDRRFLSANLFIGAPLAAVPEPASVALAALALAGAAISRRRAPPRHLD